jgi:L-alanine-DL-glutamate epimerase-like enolase superfamily enzyme
MRFESELLKIHLKETFRTSKGEADEKVVCVASLEQGLGECCPSLHYGYSAEDCDAAINSFAIEIPADPFELSGALDLVRNECGDRYSLLAGLDIAIHDYISRSLELPLWRYLGLPDPSGRESSYTISIDSPGKIESRLKDAEDFRILKLKLGSEYDEENLEILGRLPGRTVRVDANGALSLGNIEWLIKAACDYKLELIEEPLTDPSLSDLRELGRELKCPIVMDESVKTVDDIYKFENCIGGINIKLQKVGGIRNSLRMIEAARSLDMHVMFGCMLETSVGISASAHLAGMADYLDLDSIVLIEDDPFTGVTLKDGRLVFPDRPGHGAVRVS